ncbi:hypothetical protein J6590_029517 [Homalodisca vitripennis]|nr:hypothetical protein J6590_029517 [Homalodisca vitripennis]
MKLCCYKRVTLEFTALYDPFDPAIMLKVNEELARVPLYVSSSSLPVRMFILLGQTFISVRHEPPHRFP